MINFLKVKFVKISAFENEVNFHIFLYLVTNTIYLLQEQFLVKFFVVDSNLSVFGFHRVTTNYVSNCVYVCHVCFYQVMLMSDLSVREDVKTSIIYFFFLGGGGSDHVEQ